VISPNESLVIEVMLKIFERKGLDPPLLGPDTPLDGSLGLESLDFAEMVILLEEATGKDPFAEGMAQPVRTLGELAAMYD
jgi:acyl carrier protein